MLTKQPKVLIMAGGTGGHIFPGIAVANELKKRGWSISWLGSKGGMEEKLVAAESIQMNLISINGLRGNGILGWLKAPISLSRAVIESVKILNKVSPSVVIGFGGFASGPGGLASFITRTPLVIHEQNAIAGLTNKVLKIIAKMTFQAFPNAFKNNDKTDKNLKTVGNPVRNNILNLNSDLANKDNISESVNILVIGGSRGALALNQYLPLVFNQLIQNKNISILHQVGKGRVKQTENFYSASGLENHPTVEIVEFIDDMAEAYSWADIVICRAGASTVSEIAAVGICAIFIPYPYAVDDHQTANANWLVNNQAALCFSEGQIQEALFVNELMSLLNSPNKILEIASNAKKVAYINAASEVADYCDTLRIKAA